MRLKNVHCACVYRANLEAIGKRLNFLASTISYGQNVQIQTDVIGSNS